MTVELRATAPVDTAGQAPTLLEPMRDQKVDEGSQAHFRCRMVGSPGKSKNRLLGSMMKTHVHGFFDTDLHEVSWHFATHEAVRPTGF